MGNICKKPEYFFAVFGAVGPDKLPVDSGCYIHEKGYISNSRISSGDVVLLYCADSYPDIPKRTPGIGIVMDIDLSGSKEKFYYQYFPFDNPIYWELIKLRIPELENCSRFSSRGNWLRNISSTSFRNAVSGSQINWP